MTIELIKSRISVFNGNIKYKGLYPLETDIAQAPGKAPKPSAVIERMLQFLKPQTPAFTNFAEATISNFGATGLARLVGYDHEVDFGKFCTQTLHFTIPAPNPKENPTFGAIKFNWEREQARPPSLAIIFQRDNIETMQIRFVAKTIAMRVLVGEAYSETKSQIGTTLQSFFREEGRKFLDANTAQEVGIKVMNGVQMEWLTEVLPHTLQLFRAAAASVQNQRHDYLDSLTAKCPKLGPVHA